ncbi:uncharacterized protein CMU_006590 [Cryptosporidium muris RN66]|uniref:mRNA export factor GLE1 n=1 Tax=Cryptosporidium muris (strain RN66) TaxID=441375 RepID=B6AHP1_CRYMR|nr:uncharacterized protein CMU_006590 [Cryptosporidium muris RN66]EEA07736.1 hypothetical protein, conserved [Cryptosporidium muris RN66]|eukprot:XP_002142085.1 hypothetical protein [Cryptosporidium muris RN66]
MDIDKLGDKLSYTLTNWEVHNGDCLSKTPNRKGNKVINNFKINIDTRSVEDKLSSLINKHLNDAQKALENIRIQHENELRKQEELRISQEKKLLEDEKRRIEEEEIRIKNEKKFFEDMKRNEAQKQIEKTTENNIVTNTQDTLNIEDPKNKCIVNQTEERRFVEMLENYEKSKEYLEIMNSTDKDIKNTRINIKKTIQLSINQISSTQKQVLLSSNRIIELLSSLKNMKQSYDYALYMIANSLISQCSGQITAHPDSVWSYSYTYLNILKIHNKIDMMMNGIIYRSCPILLSGELKEMQNVNETEEALLQRINSIVRLYLAINIQCKNYHVIWLWLVKILNKNPSKEIPSILVTALQIIPFFFMPVFGIQFRKLLDYIHNFIIPNINLLIENNPYPIKSYSQQLEMILNELRGTTSIHEPPSGYILKDKNIDIEC